MMGDKMITKDKKVLKSKDLSEHMGLSEKVKKAPATSRVELLGDDGGVLNRKVLDAKGKARSIIEDARLEAERIREEARDLLAQVNAELEKARKKGFDTGRQEGYSVITEKVTAFERVKEDFYKNAEENIIKLVMMIAEKVIGRIVHENSEAIKSIVKQAIEKSLGERILIRLSSEDYKAVTGSESEFRDMLDRTKRIQFKEDEGIVRGGCVVETEVGTIDARLETQLKAIRKALEL